MNVRSTASASSPLVSVVVPTYGRPEFLRDALESVDEQTYAPIELVVVDDHSPEALEPTVSSFADDADVSIQFVRHDENQGANAARNTGIRESTGELLAFLDDDDVWEPTKLATQIDALQQNPGVGFVYCGMKYVGPDERVNATRCPTTSGDVREALFRGAPLNPFSCVLVRRSVVEAAGFPDERLPSWQDREWYLRLAEHCKFAAIPRPLTIRRMEDHDQLGDNYEEKRDVSYPHILEKHRPSAAALGSSVERAFVGYLSRALAYAAMRNGYYTDAMKYSARALSRNPLDVRAAACLFVSAGGDTTFGLAQKGKRLVGRGVLSG